MDERTAARYQAYRDVLDIDPVLRLNEAQGKHASSYFDVYDEWTDAQRILDECMDNLEVALARAEIDIRKELRETGERVTDRLVAAHIELVEDVREAKQAVFAAKHDERKWKALHDSYRQYGFRLKELSDKEREKIRATRGVYLPEDVVVAEAAQRRARGAKS